jgi:hypothetical protein
MAFTAFHLLQIRLRGTRISDKRDTDFMGDLSRSPPEENKEETYVD